MPVLVVDDNADIRDSHRMLLETAGYAVCEAANGEEALHALTAGLVPSLILLDLAMPVMDGFQFRAVQLSTAEFAAVPVIVYSGFPVDARRLACLQAAAFLQKPLDPDLLLGIIQAHRLPKAWAPNVRRESGSGLNLARSLQERRSVVRK